MPATVDDRHLVVPARTSRPVVVTFGDSYVWSFLPERDGTRAASGWRVPWPEALRPRLVGTTGVRLDHGTGSEVLFDAEVSFGGSSEALLLTDAKGHPLSIDKAGHLTRAFSDTDGGTRREVVEGTARALRDLRERVGIDAHLSYGALLGAVREGAMIGHDSDTDLAYLSRHTTPVDVVREALRIEREMRELGWRVVRMSGGDLKLFLPLSDGRNVHVDIFAGFHVSGVFYLLGGRSGELPREALTPAGTVELEGVALPAPADPERVLSFLYGPSWRVPDPSFQNVDPPEGVRRLNGWLRGFRTHTPAWNELLRERRAEVPKTASPFARSVHRALPPETTVVELGSGNGRDSAFFARRGRRVVSLDYSGAALRQTRRRVGGTGTEPDVRALALDDARTALLAGAELAREPAPPHLYARHLVGCLSPEARQNLWRLCSMSLRRGGALHLELSATRAGLGDWQVPGLVRRTDVGALVTEIEAAGGRVVQSEVLAGHDVLDRPDPCVARLEVQWSRTPDPHQQSTTPTTEPEDAA